MLQGNNTNKMKFPFHGVQVCGDVLFATRAGNIDSFKLSDGSHISCWKYPVEPKDEKSKLVINVSDSSTPTPSQVDQGPPAKRVKLGNGDAAAEEAGKGPDLTPSEVVNEETPRKGKKNKKHLARPAPLIQPWERPMVIIMTATQDDSHLVAVTSDKSVWVFEHDGQGLLKQLSRRCVESHPSHGLVDWITCVKTKHALLEHKWPGPLLSMYIVHLRTWTH